MNKTHLTKTLQTLFILLAVSTLTFAQKENADLETFKLHVNFQPTQGEMIQQNLRREEASNFDAPNYIATNKDNGTVRIFGTQKSASDFKYFNFDSSNLSKEEDCAKFCEKITKLERVPYFGFAIKPMEDFSGVEITNIIEDSNAADSPLEVGDIITSIETAETTNPCELLRAVDDQTVDEWVEVNYIRNGKSKSTMILMGYRVKKHVTWVACCDNITNEDPQIIATPTAHLNLDIFPNPTAGVTQFEIGTSSINKTTIQLMNLNGQVLKEMKVFPIDGYWQDYLDLSKYADGVYVLHVTQDKAKTSKRIVLQKK